MKALDGVGREHEEFRLRSRRSATSSWQASTCARTSPRRRPRSWPRPSSNAKINIVGGDGAVLRPLREGGLARPVDRRRRSDHSDVAADGLRATTSTATQSLPADLKEILSRAGPDRRTRRTWRSPRCSRKLVQAAGRTASASSSRRRRPETKSWPEAAAETRPWRPRPRAPWPQPRRRARQRSTAAATRSSARGCSRRRRSSGERAEALNARRKELFGGTELAVLGNERVRTEHNCVPRDIVGVGEHLLFGYNVFLGPEEARRRSRTSSRCTTSSRPTRASTSPRCRPPRPAASSPTRASSRTSGSCTATTRTRGCCSCARTEARLLAVFQIGASRARREGVPLVASTRTGRVTYIDNRGERDHVFPPSHDFEWTPATREDHVAGRAPARQHPRRGVRRDASAATSPSRSRTTPRTGRASTASRSTTPNQSLDDARDRLRAASAR